MLISQAHAATDAAGSVPFYADSTFWVAMAFVLFFVIFGKKLTMVGGGMLDDRADKIKAELDEAAKLREEAQDLLASYEKKQHEALKEAESIVQAAKEEAARLADEASEQLDRSLKRSEQMAQDRIKQAEAQAIADVKAQAVDLAMIAAKTIMEKDVTGKKADDLIDQSVKDLEGKLH